MWLRSRVGGTPPPSSVLTNYYQFFFTNHVSYKFKQYSDFAKMKIFTDFQILPGYITLDHHLSTGHLAFLRVVFKVIKHPHFLHVWDSFLKNGHPLQISRRYATNSSWDLGELGFNKSHGLTSSSDIYPVYPISPYI